MATWFKISLIITGLVFVWCLIAIPVVVAVEAQCLAYGYPNNKVTLGFTGYCIKRVDQTDVVVKLSDLRSR